ncbi:MAG: DUF2244 domain-containing protein [Ectothiorhodospiraceae bacterium]|nr:DUF2244 domain-containing protein [Ectothiorhodospiraceae bacterium]
MTRQDDARCFVLRPNVGLYWRTTVRVYVITVIVTLTVALSFTLAGFWPILPFAGVELVALGVALYVTARRGRYREVVRIDERRIEIEKGYRGPEQSWAFDRVWSEVVLEPPAHRWHPSRLVIRCGAGAVELGAFLTEPERIRLGRELRRCIGPVGTQSVEGGPISEYKQ